MKHCLRVLVWAWFFAAWGLSLSAWAADFDKVIRSVNVERPDTTTQVLSGRVYGASVVGTIKDADGDNQNFKGTDRLTATLTGRTGRTLSFSGNKAEFDQFVKDKADEIVGILLDRKSVV